MRATVPRLTALLMTWTLGLPSCSDSDVPDGSEPDTGQHDSGPPDGGPVDAGPADGGTGSGLVVEIHDPNRAFQGTTLLAESATRRVIEVDMEGNVVWEWVIPGEYLQPDDGPPEADLLPSGNVQVLIQAFGVLEVSRGTDGHEDGEVVWSAAVGPLDHDADRLPDGNVLYVFGMGDVMGDVTVTEIQPDGAVVWEWIASGAYGEEFGTAARDWAHVNAVQRLQDGNTLVGPRNFFLTTIVDESGTVVRELRYDAFGSDTDPHEPNLLPNGNLLVCLQNDSPYQAIEVTAGASGEVDPVTDVVWSYRHPTGFRTARDCDRLPNGNTLILGVQFEGESSRANQGDDESTILEVTPEGDVVWQLTLEGYDAEQSPGFFYKAQRLGQGAPLAD